MRPPAYLAAVLGLAAPPAAAHPHVFVDTAMEVAMDAEGRVLGVRMRWTYDELFTLMLTEDLGLDGDGDMVLTPDEEATLRASVLDWPADFAGDLAVTKDGQALPLGPRADAEVALVDGRLVESHFRPLLAPAPAPVVIENYDPYYYVSYAVASGVAVAGAPGCAASVTPADLAAGQAEVDRLFAGLDVAGAGADVTLPPVGFAFADRVEVSCAP